MPFQRAPSMAADYRSKPVFTMPLSFFGAGLLSGPYAVGSICTYLITYAYLFLQSEPLLFLLQEWETLAGG